MGNFVQLDYPEAASSLTAMSESSGRSTRLIVHQSARCVVTALSQRIDNLACSVLRPHHRHLTTELAEFVNGVHGRVAFGVPRVVVERRSQTRRDESWMRKEGGFWLVDVMAEGATGWIGAQVPGRTRDGEDPATL